MSEEFKLIPLERIKWSKPVREISLDDMEQMAKSIQRHGQLMPIIVKPAEEDMYEGVCGRLRYEAMKYLAEALGLKEYSRILCRVRKFKDESEVKEWQLVENLHRKELSAIEKVKAFKELAELLEKRGEKNVAEHIADRIEAYTHKRPAIGSVKKALSIAKRLKKPVYEVPLGTPELAQKLKIKHLEQISRLPDPITQQTLLQKCLNQAWSVGKLKKEVDKALGLPVKETMEIVKEAFNFYPAPIVHLVYEYSGSEKFWRAIKNFLLNLFNFVREEYGEEKLHEIARETAGA